MFGQMGFLQAVRELAHSVKDAGVGFVIERAVAHRIQPYGRMLSFSIDSKTSRIRLEVLPKGEAQPITIMIDEYALSSDGGADFILIKKASASREWMHALLQDFAIGKKLPLPPKYANILKSVLT
jgi:hypothetical protein